MTDTRPLWLLDVDGVLNAHKPGWGAAPYRTRVLADGEFWTLRWAPALVQRIWALHRSGLVEIRWATSWIGNTDKIEAALHLPHFENAYPDPAPGVAYKGEIHTHAKREAFARAYVTDLRRVIWTDDAAIPEGWLARTDATIADALFIAPRPNRGLQPEHLDAIEAFARQYTPRRSHVMTATPEAEAFAKVRTITVLCDEAMLTLLAPLKHSKTLRNRYGHTYVAAEYVEAALLAIDEDDLKAAGLTGAWWREMGGCNTAIAFDADAIKEQGVLAYLCEVYGISSERNVAVALNDMAGNAGMTEIELLDWIVDNASADAAYRHL